jgi:bis(5'-nucleosidyl)-tetraphosphatase
LNGSAAGIRHRSAGIVVVCLAAGEWRFLLLRAYRHWGFPKGLIEPGESVLAAARRETREETGLVRLDFRWGEASIDTGIYGDRKVASYFLAATACQAIELPVNPELGRPEHDEYRWVTGPVASKLLPGRLQPVLDWAVGKITRCCE